MSQVFATDALRGKSVLVTGGGSGLGREIASALAEHGATVHLCGRRAEVLEEAARGIAATVAGAAVHVHTCDLRNAEDVDAMIARIWNEGPLTGLINNAAANFIAQTRELSVRGYRAVTSTVMDGSFHATLGVGKRWIADGLKGSVVSNLVTWVWTGSAFAVPSAMAKTALHAMTMSLAVEWGPYGIRLNAVAPGPFPTAGAWARLNPTDETRSSVTSLEQVPMRRFGQMSELRSIHVFLQSDACDYLTGQTIAVDGGQHLAGPGTFADLARLSDEQWRSARAAIDQAVTADKARRSI